MIPIIPIYPSILHPPIHVSLSFLFICYPSGSVSSLSSWLLSIFLTYLLVFGRPGSLLLHAGSLQSWRVGTPLWLRHPGLSLRLLVLLWSAGSRACGLRSCSSQAQQLWHRGLAVHGTRDPPGPGIEPMSPALTSRFFTSGSPRKPWLLSVSFTASRTEPGEWWELRNIFFYKINGWVNLCHSEKYCLSDLKGKIIHNLCPITEFLLWDDL